MRRDAKSDKKKTGETRLMKIVADIFPAHLSLAARDVLEDLNKLNAYNPVKIPNVFYVEKTRVLLVDMKEGQSLIVAQDSPDGPLIVFREKIDFYIQSEDTFRVKTASGKFVAFKKDRNCGCGSRLRSWNPYKTLSSIHD